MPNTLLESLSCLVFPVECEICGCALNPNPPMGICGSCAGEIPRIAPPHCEGCGRTLMGQNPRCAKCLEESYSFDKAFACAPYEEHMKRLIHTYKFKRRKYLKYYFIKIMREFIRLNLSPQNFDAVLPVPISSQRFLERGFNQSELISLEIAREFRLPHSSGNLIRAKSETPQSLLTKTGRKVNVQDAFLVRRPELFDSKKLLLIDDILTTGQTASECAKTLKKAGAASVTVLALARGI